MSLIQREHRVLPLVIAVFLAACSGSGEAAPAASSTPAASIGPLSLPRGSVTIRRQSDPDPLSFAVEFAGTEEARRQGLMGRSYLDPNLGMVFNFDYPVEGTFWMKNTLIPLTIAFWDSSGRIVDIFDMEPCDQGDSCPKFHASAPYVGALEVNAGALEGVQVGDTVYTQRWAKR